LPSASPKQSVNTCQEFSQRKRLRKVVVGSQLEPDDSVDDLTARREHEYRQHLVLAAQIAQDVQARAAREHDVENEYVRAKGGYGCQRIVTAANDLNIVAFIAEIVGKPTSQSWIILDQ
jgi:hypothetical protein